MKTLLMVVVFVFLASGAWADPYLVCDMPPASDNVTGCEVEVDGTVYPGSCLTTTSAPEICGDGSCYELADLGSLGLPSGQHNIRARFFNAWGSSVWSDAITGGAPGVPSTLRIK